MIQGLIKRIDMLLHRYLGIEKDEITPENVCFVGNKVFIKSHSSYKRHLIKESWDEFSRDSINNTSNKENTDLGVAVGKALAKNLIIKFEDTKLF